jgi:hypothetical protein
LLEGPDEEVEFTLLELVDRLLHRGVVIAGDATISVAGVWRVVDGGIEATAFHPLSEDTWEGLAAEARSLAAFLAGREPDV